MQSNRKTAFALLFIVMVVLGLSNSSLFVILPVLARSVGVGEMQVGMVYVGSALLFMLGSPFWGWQADLRGRRPVLLLGVLGNVLTAGAMALVGGWMLGGHIGAGLAISLMALARLIYGILGSAIQPAAQGYIADRTERHERTRMLSLLAAGMGFGAMFGPPVAAFFVARFSGPAMLWGLSAISLVLFVALSLAMPEHQRPHWQGVTGKQMMKLATNDRLRSLLIIGILAWTAQSVFLQTASFFVADRLHMSVEMATPKVGVVLALGAVCALAVQFILIPMWKPAPRTLLVTGVGIAMLGAGAMVIASSYVWILCAVTVSSTGLSMVRPGLSGAASLRHEASEQGAAAGLVTATAGAGFVLAPLLGLPLYHVSGPGVTFAVMALVMLVAWLMAWRQPHDSADDAD